MPESEDGMKQFKERVRIGTDEHGKAVYKWATGNNQTELHLSIAKILFENGQLDGVSPTRTDGPMFNDYMRDWYENIRSKQAPDRVDEERGRLKNYIYPFFEGRRLSEIKPRDIDAYFMQNKVQRLAKSTASKHGQFLNMMFRFAIKNEDIDKNPATDYKQLLPKRSKKREPLSKADAADIFCNLPKLRDEDRLFVSLLLLTGMRRGEALGLQVKHINPLRHEVIIEQAERFISGKGVLKSPKTKSSIRTIPILPGFPYDLVEGMNPDGFVLGGASPWTERKLVCAWERISRTIDMHGATPHILRHTYATLAIVMGEDLKTVQGIMGHARADTTMNIYAHLQQSKILEAGKLLEGMYSPAV